MTKGQMILAIMDLKDNDGLTFRNFVSVHYKTGWQVATEGITTTNPILAGMAAYDMEETVEFGSRRASTT